MTDEYPKEAFSTEQMWDSLPEQVRNGLTQLMDRSVPLGARAIALPCGTEFIRTLFEYGIGKYVEGHDEGYKTGSSALGRTFAEITELGYAQPSVMYFPAEGDDVTPEQRESPFLATAISLAALDLIGAGDKEIEAAPDFPMMMESGPTPLDAAWNLRNAIKEPAE